MQAIQKDVELPAEIQHNDKARNIHMPKRRSLIVAGAISGGAVAAGLVMFYYLWKRAKRT